MEEFCGLGCWFGLVLFEGRYMMVIMICLDLRGYSLNLEVSVEDPFVCTMVVAP